MRTLFKRGAALLLLAVLLAGLFPAAMAATVPEVKSATENHFYTSNYLGLMYLPGAQDYYLNYFDLTVDGKTIVGYCASPYYSHPTGSLSVSDWDNWAFPYPGVDDSKKEKLGLALALGENGADISGPEALKTSTVAARAFATQAVIWDILDGKDKSSSSIRSHISALTGVYEDHRDGGDPLATVSGDEALKFYDTVWDKINSAGIIPSFTKSSAKDFGSSTTITLKSSGSSYTATVTDTRGVLEDYHFHCDVPGVTFARSGNTLTITATAEAARVIGTSGVIASSRGSTPDSPVEPWEACLVLSGGNGPQPVIATRYPTDPVPCYFKLVAEEQNGKIEIVKTTNTGKDLGGWQIGIYTDAACSSPISGSPFTTGDDGHILTGDLKAGTYYAQELNGSHGYWTGDDSVKTVTVEAGKTATVTFSNIEYGRVQIVKTTNTGRDLAGWKIGIYTDPDCQHPVSGSPFTTGEDGTITTGAWAGTAGVNGCLLPGTYYAQEIGGGDDYWSLDTEVKTVTVEAGETATVTFSNVEYGRVKIVKTTNTGKDLGGWQIGIYTDADCTSPVAGSPFITSADGTIISGNLLPGTYYAQEIGGGDGYWSLDPERKTVTVVAGETATVTFTNTLRLGEIRILKTDPQGQPLAGARFLLEWSEDGSSWQAVTFSNADFPVAGGCTSEGITDGCLVSDADGVAAFTGLYPTLQYRLTETAAPAGYQLLEGYAFEGPLPQKTLTVTLTVVNAPAFRLPETGGNGLVILPVLAALCWCLCFSLGSQAFRGKKRG